MSAKGNRRENQVNPGEKWIRLQEVGLSQILTIPIALVAGETFRLNFIIIAAISIALCWSGVICFMLGRDKRRVLQEREAIKDKGGQEHGY